MAAPLQTPLSLALLPSYWEAQFFEDMARLHVQRPDTLTRVTEYLPEIVAFVQRIIDNGFAYEGEGNVYFNSDAFKASKDHNYPKLQPGNTGDDDECGLKCLQRTFTQISHTTARGTRPLANDQKTTLPSGNDPNLGSLSGIRHGVPGVLAGI